MDDMFLLISLVILLLSIPCLVLAYLVGIKQKRSLISSFDETAYNDPRRVAQIIGFGVFLTGFLTAISVIAWGMGMISLTHVGIVFCIAVAAPLFTSLYTQIVCTCEKS